MRVKILSESEVIMLTNILREARLTLGYIKE